MSIILAGWAAYPGATEWLPPLLPEDRPSSAPTPEPVVQLEGRYELISGVEYVWQRPARSEPVGILLLCHGCNHGAGDFFPRTEHCPTCLGLPVETGIASAGLARGWVVLAVSSRDRKRRCWNEARDLKGLAQAIAIVRRVCGLGEDSALAAIGASSGGRIVSLLDEAKIKGPLVGIVAQVSASAKEGWRHDAMTGRWDPSTHIPVRFLVMERDGLRFRAVTEQVIDYLSPCVHIAPGASSLVPNFRECNATLPVLAWC